MVDWLRYAAIAVALLLAPVAYLDFRSRRWPRPHTLVLTAVGIALGIAEAVVAAVLMSDGHAMRETEIFIGYVATNAILLPAAAYVVHVERSRWGSLALVIGGLLVALLQVRMQQLWTR